MSILDHGAFSEWGSAFDHLERARARAKAAEQLPNLELRAYTAGELDKANKRYLAAVAAFDA